jgi:hypothetical protein
VPLPNTRVQPTGRSARVLSVAFAALLAACTRWEAMPTPIAPADLPRSVRVWSTDGARTLLSAPFVRQDTLYGRSGDDTVGIALTRIERVARPRLNAAKSAGTLVGGLAAWLTLALLTLRD